MGFEQLLLAQSKYKSDLIPSSATGNNGRVGAGWRLSMAFSLATGIITKAKFLTSYHQEGTQETQQTLHSVLDRDQLFLSSLM